MIDFQPVTLSDRDWIEKRLQEAARLGCEYSFGNIFTYGAKMPLGAADVCGCLITRCELPEIDYYCFPIGGGDRAAALRTLLESVNMQERAAHLYGMDENDKTLLEAQAPGAFNIYLERDSFDYVYRTEDLTSLSGKKYQSKRNHISFFLRNNRWSYERISPENKAECLAMSEAWLAQSEHADQKELQGELLIIRCAFENYEALGYCGGLLRTDGKVIAYTMGEPLSDEMFCVHFEKAFADVRGAYAMMNRQFVQQELQGYRYINREDDVGALNLRRAKESYHPAFFIEEYETRLK